MNIKEKILMLLRQQSGFVSGQSICEELGVSRTAVWKYINSLKEEGYEIESITRKGYRLLQSPNLVTKEELLQWIPQNTFGGNLLSFPEVDSTNEEAKRQAAANLPDGSVIVADRQTAGKGRRGRTWFSPKGDDLFFSILLRPDLPAECASMLTLVAAAAAVETAEKFAGMPCQIKWPNDIVLHDKKICGILTEMSAEMTEIQYVVVGIGFNLNRMDFAEEIVQMATSIRRESGKKVTRAAFLADFLERFFEKYCLFLKEQNLRSFMENYNDHLINRGRQVKIMKNRQEQIRKALGINDMGELVVETESGETETIISGEVSVRGLYGYV